MAAIPSPTVRHGLFEGYDTGGFYDEMFIAPGQPRPQYSKLFQKLGAMAPAQFEERRKLADLSFLIQGITFTVYSDGQGTERLFPFDLIPRILPHSEWERIDRGFLSVSSLSIFFCRMSMGSSAFLGIGRFPALLSIPALISGGR